MNENEKKEMIDEETVVEAEKVKNIEQLDVLDKYRNKFVKEINLIRYISYAVAALTIVIVIVSYVFLMKINAWAGIVPVILALIGAGAFSFFSRRHQEGKIQKYMSDYNNVINQQLTAGFVVNEYFYDYRDGLKTKTFANANILQGVTESASRNLNSYAYKDYKVSTADFVAYTRDGKRLVSVFAGKLFSTTRTKSVKEQVILYLKPNKEVFKESGEPEITHLKVVEDSDNYRIYSAGKYKTVLPQKALDEILKIERNDVLADLTVSIVDNTVTILLSYGKDIIAVPYKEPVPHLAIRKYIKDITHILKFLDLI